MNEFQPYVERLEPVDALRDAIAAHEPYVLLLDGRLATNLDRATTGAILQHALRNLAVGNRPNS